MPTTNGEESLGKTVLRGAAWGVGFTVAVGLLHWGWHAVTDDSDDHDDDEDEWREHFASRRDYLEWQLENEIRRTGEPDEEED